MSHPMVSRSQLEEQLRLRQHLARRRESDPLFNWTPTEKQRPFIESVLLNRKPMNGFIAGNRSGKSDSGAYCGAMLARYGSDSARFVGGQGSPVQVKDRATSGWVVTPDFPSSRDVIQPKYFDNGNVPPGATHGPFIPKHEIKEWRVSDQVLRLKNGSIVGFKSSESERDKFQGTEKDWIQFDEEPPKDIYEECVIRVGARPMKIFFTCTLLPEEGMAGGVSWMFPEIIQPWQAGELPHVGLFGASIYDNPFIPPETIAFMESIYPVGSIGRQIRLDGLWLPGLSGARAYSAFQRSLHVREQPEINLHRPLCWFWDFNVEPMCSGIGQTDGRLYRVHKEFVLDEGSIPEMVEAFMMEYPRHYAEVWLYGDATGNRRQHHTSEMESSWTLILNLMRNYGVPVRKRIPEANPFVPERLNAVNRLFKDEAGEIRVEIDPGCKELIADLEQVLTDGKGRIKKVSDRKNPYFKRTHVCMAGDTLVKTASGEQRIDQISEGDIVVTPAGHRRVLWAGETKKVKELVEVCLSNGETIKCTEEHKFLTERGLVTADELRCSDCLITGDHLLCRNAVSSMTGKSSGLGLRDAITGLIRRETPASVENQSICTATSGNSRPIAVENVRRARLPRPVPVYDLTVDVDHCYEVAGVLVSNSDAFGYWLAREEPVRRIRGGRKKAVSPPTPRYATGG